MDSKKPNPELIDEENPEITDEEFAHARPALEGLAEIFGKRAAEDLEEESHIRRGRPRKIVKSKPTTIRLDPNVEAFFRATGPGWQTRINDVLRSWVLVNDEEGKKRLKRKRVEAAAKKSLNGRFDVKTSSVINPRRGRPLSPIKHGA
jgi:uncharacterized protein (DUF4415 family)